jgi:hypothetical protein
VASQRLSEGVLVVKNALWPRFHAAPVNIEKDLGVEAVALERRRYFRTCSAQSLYLLGGIPIPLREEGAMLTTRPMHESINRKLARLFPLIFSISDLPRRTAGI